MSYATIDFSKSGEFSLHKVWGGLVIRAGTKIDGKNGVLAPLIKQRDCK